MSAYIHFFVRAGGTFCPIATYCRNSKVYEIFHRAPYEQITTLDKATLNDYFDEATIMRDNLKEDRIKYEKRIETIKGFENSAEEKLELICECEELIEETDSELLVFLLLFLMKYYMMRHLEFLRVSIYTMELSVIDQL